jgi:hypothetical protein
MLLVVISGCKCDWYFTKAQQKGCFKRDTVTITKKIPGGTIKGEVQVFKDITYLDSIVYKDTCYNSEDVKREVRKAVKNIPCKIKPFTIDTFGVKLKVYYEDGTPKYIVEKKPEELKVDCLENIKVETKEVLPWWVKFTWIFGGVVILGLVLKRGEKK